MTSRDALWTAGVLHHGMSHLMLNAVSAGRRRGLAIARMEATLQARTCSQAPWVHGGTGLGHLMAQALCSHL